MARSPAEEFARLRDEVTRLRKTVSDGLDNDPVREKAFEILYEELRAYRDDFLAQAEKPLLLDLLLLYDSFLWFQQTVVQEQMSAETVADSFQFLLDELLEVLYRRDVVPMERKDTFDPKNQRALQAEPAKRPEDDRRIARVVRRGFLRNGNTLRPEEVVVLKWRGGDAKGGPKR